MGRLFALALIIALSVFAAIFALVVIVNSAPLNTAEIGDSYTILERGLIPGAKNPQPNLDDECQVTGAYLQGFYVEGRSDVTEDYSLIEAGTNSGVAVVVVWDEDALSSDAIAVYIIDGSGKVKEVLTGTEIETDTPPLCQVLQFSTPGK